MKKWTAPVKPNDLLYLPCSKKKGAVTTGLFASESICVPVDADYISAWHQGPKNKKNSAELAQMLACLIHTFHHLIRLAQNQLTIRTKSTPLDFVTQVDSGIEILFRLWLKKHYPKHKIVGEEGKKAAFASGDTVWYIDPIDGTANYCQGSDAVSLHIGAVSKGKPYVACVGLPIKNALFYASKKGVFYSTSPTQSKPFKFIATPPKTLTIGTEFMPHKTQEREQFEHICQMFKSKPYRVKSVGCNMLKLLACKISLFYKPEVKYWDMLAPLVLIYFAARHYYDFDMVFSKKGDNKLVRKQCLRASPFSMTGPLLTRLNKKHRSDCRIGLLMVTPKKQKKLKARLLDELVGHA